MMWAGVMWVVVVATPPSPWNVPAITQPQGPTEEFSDTLSLTREQTTPHTGAVNKKDAMKTPRAEHPRQYTAEPPMTAHRHADIPDDLLSNYMLFTLQVADSH